MITLHIGTDKTGSTAIQKLMYYNKDILKQIGWLYPELMPMAGYRHWILFDLLENEKNRKTFKKNLQNIEKNSLLSFEEFYNLSDENIKVFISELKRYDQDIKILIYLRRQDEKEISGILQGIKTGNIFNMQNFEFVYKPILDYYKIIKKWERYVGKENIIIRPYNKKFLPERDSLIKDFFKYGMNLDYEQSKQKLIIPKSDPNPSLDAVSGMVIDFLANIIKDESKWSLIYQLLGIQEKYGKSTKSLFNREEREKILDLYKESNEKLIEEYKVPKALFELDDKEYDKPDEDDIMERIKALYHRKEMLLTVKEWGGEGTFIDKINNNKIILKKGFFHIEKWGVWSKGDEESQIAFLVFRDYMNGNDKIKVTITVKYTHIDMKSYIKIYDNEWKLLNNAENTYEIATQQIRESGGTVFIKIKNENAKSPKELGINNDNRILGIGIEDINFKECM